MKKLILIAVVLAFAGMAFAQDFEAGNDNALYHMPKYVNSYTKDKIVTLSINGPAAADSALPGAGKYVSWVAPMAVEIVAAYLITSDSVVAADTVTNLYECQVYTNNRVTVDTAFYYAGTTESKRLQPFEEQSMTATTTVSKRSVSKGEVLTVVWEDTGTPVSNPIDLKCVLLLRPKSYPVTADYTTRP